MEGPRPGPGAVPQTYVWGYGEAAHARMGVRTASAYASYLLPHLRPGMALLDCGCGPGSITLDLAEAVSPGEVVGVDLKATQIERARALARERHAANVRFETASVYALPFPDASFDAVHANALLEHLSDPVRALREFRRVLRPGAVIGVQSPDLSTRVLSPSLPPVEAAVQLTTKALSLTGSPYCARHLRGLLGEAGFARSEGFAFAEYHGDPATTRAFANVAIEVLREPVFVEAAISRGWTDAEGLAAIVAALRTWGEEPAAFYAALWCGAVGWVDERR